MRLSAMPWAAGPLHRARALWRDRRGASLVQFIAVLPAFIVIVYGAYAAYMIMMAHHTLCDASWQASRYLQVEGPHFEEEFQPYPDYWEEVAVDIAVDATAGQRSLRVMPWSTDNIEILPRDRKPVWPDGPEHVEVQRLRDYHFTVRVTQDITNPLGTLFPRGVRPVDPDDPNPPPQEEEGPRPGTVRLTCQYTGFMEGPPFKPSAEPGSDTDPNCPQCPSPRLDPCTPGPGPTPCPGGPSNPACPTAVSCPVCCPR